MSIIQTRSKRKPSGGINKSHLKKKLHSLGRAPTLTKLGVRKTKTLRTIGGHVKTILLVEEFANIYDKKEKKYKKVKIKSIVENPANRHFVVKNIMTKGAIIETEIGKAKVTSRPGQEGTVNAVLL